MKQATVSSSTSSWTSSNSVKDEVVSSIPAGVRMSFGEVAVFCFVPQVQ